MGNWEISNIVTADVGISSTAARNAFPVVDAVVQRGKQERRRESFNSWLNSRNCLIHRGGRVDARTKREAPSLAIEDGGLLRISSERYLVYHEAVAELMLALLLGVTKSVALNDRTLRSGVWSQKLTAPIRGRTVGLIGLGRIGKSTAVRCAALGMRVIAHEQFPDRDFVTKNNIPLVELDDLLAQSDFVSLHCPLNDATRGLCNAAFFAKMKPGSVLINTARGGLVVEDDLISALKSGHLSGAGLDVFQQEPLPPTSPLLQLDNVVLCPHLGGTDTRSSEDMGIECAHNIVKLSRNEWPEGAVVNADLRPSWKW